MLNHLTSFLDANYDTWDFERGEVFPTFQVRVVFGVVLNKVKPVCAFDKPKWSGIERLGYLCVWFDKAVLGPTLAFHAVADI